MSGRVVHFEMPYDDGPRARAFYGELFGWTSEETGPEYGGDNHFSKGGGGTAGRMEKHRPMGVSHPVGGGL